MSTFAQAARVLSASRTAFYTTRPHPILLRCPVSQQALGFCLQISRGIADGLSKDAQEALNVRKRDSEFIDRIRVRVAGGNGGKGCASLWKSSSKGKFVPADGGNGGGGGSVVLRASPTARSLAHVLRSLAGGRGGGGGPQRRHGRTGTDLVVDVPCGTVVYLDVSAQERAAQQEQQQTEWQNQQQIVAMRQRLRSERAQQDQPAPGTLQHQAARQRTEIDYATGAAQLPLAPADGSGAPRDSGAAGGDAASPTFARLELPVMADLVHEGDSVTAAAGGDGGRGNATYRNAPGRPASKQHEAGTAGEVRRLVLEMKLLADIGLVGFPNAGKSTLLRGISRATPQVASYPFTTLQPQLGMVVFSDGGSLSVADIPGLIEGAHANRGLGHAFLRHIQRTRALLFVLDLSGALFPNGPPMPAAQQLALLRRELELYDPALLRIPALVAANKIDAVPHSESQLAVLRDATEMPVFEVSAAQRQGLDALCGALRPFAAQWGGRTEYQLMSQ